MFSKVDWRGVIIRCPWTKATSPKTVIFCSFPLIFVHFDDMLIISKIHQEHLFFLKQVLSILSDNGRHINPDKVLLLPLRLNALVTGRMRLAFLPILHMSSLSFPFLLPLISSLSKSFWACLISGSARYFYMSKDLSMKYTSLGPLFNTNIL